MNATAVAMSNSVGGTSTHDGDVAETDVDRHVDRFNWLLIDDGTAWFRLLCDVIGKERIVVATKCGLGVTSVSHVGTYDDGFGWCCLDN